MKRLVMWTTACFAFSFFCIEVFRIFSTPHHGGVVNGESVTKELTSVNARREFERLRSAFSSKNTQSTVCAFWLYHVRGGSSSHHKNMEDILTDINRKLSELEFCLTCEYDRGSNLKCVTDVVDSYFLELLIRTGSLHIVEELFERNNDIPLNSRETASGISPLSWLVLGENLLELSGKTTDLELRKKVIKRILTKNGKLPDDFAKCLGIASVEDQSILLPMCVLQIVELSEEEKTTLLKFTNKVKGGEEIYQVISDTSSSEILQNEISEKR